MWLVMTQIMLVCIMLYMDADSYDLARYNCPEDKPFKCTSGMCADFQTYCAHGMVEPCFTRKNNKDIRQFECSYGHSEFLLTHSACKFACLDKFPDLEPFPICFSDRAFPRLVDSCYSNQSTGFQTYCKDGKVVSCFRDSLKSFKDQRLFCLSEEGRNFSSPQLYHPCKFACADRFPELSRKADLTDVSNSSLDPCKNLTDHRPNADPKDFETNDAAPYSSNPNQRTSCTVAIAISVVVTGVTMIIVMAGVTFVLVKSDIVVIKGICLKKDTDTTQEDVPDVGLQMRDERQEPGPAGENTDDVPVNRPFLHNGAAH